MIHDTLKNAGRYAGLGEKFVAAFAWAERLERQPADGRREIAGEELFATVMSYQTKRPENRTQEAHRIYADVQVMLQGEELIHLTPATAVGKGDGYQDEKDFELFSMPAEHSMVRLREGEFAVFFPGEGHKPGLAIAAPQPVRKVVIKVRV